MHMSQLHYLPLAPGFFSILVGLFIALFVVLLVLRALRNAYLSLGVARSIGFAALNPSYEFTSPSKAPARDKGGEHGVAALQDRRVASFDRP